MKKLYTARDSLEAHFLRNLLEAQGIHSTVLGDALGAARGELPMTQETLPAVWVNSEDVERAQDLVEEYENRGAPADEDDLERVGWTCPNCGEVIEGQFGMCWNCQTVRGIDEQSGNTTMP